MKRLVKLPCVGLVLLLSAACGGEEKAPDSDNATQEAQLSEKESVEEVVASTNPAADPSSANSNKNVYFGDLHIHTKNSFDAYIFNVRSTPDDVYRFAKGESVRHPSGFDISLGGDPLDFVAATDHGAYMGILPAMDDPNSPLSKVDMANEMFGTDPEMISRAFAKMGFSIRNGQPYEEIYDREIIDSTWQGAIDAANKHYEPGKLTTFAAYEFTAVSIDNDGTSIDGGNLHRNVVFENSAPSRLFSTLDSINPEHLWDWMDQQREAGRDVLAIPHNSNVSDGRMFELTTYNGNPITAEYSEQRILNEPIVEITQVKGTSETHPALSPNDEWANFEIYEYLLSSTTKSKINGSFIREALANGLKIQNETGINSYKFGFIGSSDTHVAGGAFEEKDYWSKVGIIDGMPEGRGSVPPGGSKTWEGIQRDQNAELWFSRWSASGLAAVWAEENTRESIFEAMQRKETYATSGPRIKLRFFAGYDFAIDVQSDPDLVSKAYDIGVPMGGTLGKSDKSPDFLVWAVRDPKNAPLQRVQIIKSWFENGEAREEIFDVACSDGAIPDADTNRCPDNGASVDLSDCSISTESGAPDLRVMWRDPDFDPEISASYYVRALENPTCRWSTWDALRAGVERHPDLPPTLQERAWSSPIWYDARS